MTQTDREVNREISGCIVAALVPAPIRKIADRLTGLDTLAALGLANELDIALGKVKLRAILESIKL
jgi:hypothetical protein